MQSKSISEIKEKKINKTPPQKEKVSESPQEKFKHTKNGQEKYLATSLAFTDKNGTTNYLQKLTTKGSLVLTNLNDIKAWMLSYTCLYLNSLQYNNKDKTKI